MSATVEDLRVLVNTSTTDNAVLQHCLSLGETLVTRYTRRVADGGVPVVVRDEAVLMVAADQFNRRKAPNGIVNQQFAGLDGVATPIRVNRDPFASIRQLLAPWVPSSSSGLRTVALTNPIDEPT